MDNTKEFREIKKESIEATRRRMSSFPPSDGDESSIMLEKIHYLSSIQQAASEAGTPISPLKLLKKIGSGGGGCIEAAGGSGGAGGGGLGLRGYGRGESKEWKSAIEISSKIRMCGFIQVG